jgi:hypothetical protein
VDCRHGDVDVSTYTIITANNGNPASGSAISYGSDAFTNFSQVAGDPNTLGTIGNAGDKVLNTENSVLYIYNGTWVAIAFVVAT